LNDSLYSARGTGGLLDLFEFAVVHVVSMALELLSIFIGKFQIEYDFKINYKFIGLN